MNAIKYLGLFSMSKYKNDYMGFNNKLIHSQRDQFETKHKLLKVAEKETLGQLQNLKYRMKRNVSFGGSGDGLISFDLKKLVRSKTILDN